MKKFVVILLALVMACGIASATAEMNVQYIGSDAYGNVVMPLHLMIGDTIVSRSCVSIVGEPEADSETLAAQYLDCAIYSESQNALEFYRDGVRLMRILLDTDPFKLTKKDENGNEVDDGIMMLGDCYKDNPLMSLLMLLVKSYAYYIPIP